MNDFSKNRTLALYNILNKYSDEQHQLSMQDILRKMELEGYACSADSILRYIKQLRNELGVDIVSGRGRNAKYFIGARFLEKEELKLIIDSVNASNFIEEGVSSRLVKKLKESMSVYEAEELDRSILGINIAKAENTKILYNVNVIQDALKKGMQISFDYLRWNKDKRLEKSASRKYTLNPWGLIWANDRYYLYGYDVKAKDGILGERHYRVDKLANIELLDVPRKGERQFSRFDANTYVSRRMGMFSGNEEMITVRVSEKLVGAFIDQFGKKIMISPGKDGMLNIAFHAVPSKILLGWFVGLEQVEILSPSNVVEDMKRLIETNKNMYGKKN